MRLTTQRNMPRLCRHTLERIAQEVKHNTHITQQQAAGLEADDVRLMVLKESPQALVFKNEIPHCWDLAYRKPVTTKQTDRHIKLRVTKLWRQVLATWDGGLRTKELIFQINSRRGRLSSISLPLSTVQSASTMPCLRVIGACCCFAIHGRTLWRIGCV